MKQSKRCQKCQSTEIYHSPYVMDRGEGNAAMCLAIRRTGPIDAHEVGRFEVFVCRSCGYSELYVVDFADLGDSPTTVPCPDKQATGH